MADDKKLKEQDLPLEGGKRKLPVFSVGPRDEKVPALIVVHEIFGLNDHIRDVARRFAKAGNMRVFAPDLFHGRFNLPDDRNDLDAMRAVWASIPDKELIEDLNALYAMIAKRSDVVSDTIGTIGYCMGGAIAFMFACSNPTVAFCIDYYGRVRYPELNDNKPKHPVDYVRANVCPVLGIFSGIDPLIPQEDVAMLDERLKASSPDTEVHIYLNAPHAFFNDTRENYREEEAEDAWAKTLKFIDRQITVKHK